MVMRIFSIVFALFSLVGGIYFVYEFYHLSESNVNTVLMLLVGSVVSSLLSMISDPKASENTKVRGLSILIAVVFGVIATLFAINIF